jgi:O-antigen ligase
MKFIKKSILNYKNKPKIFIGLLFFWTSLWLSISSYPNDIIVKNIYSTINGLRNINALTFSFLSFIFIFCIYIKNFSKISIKLFDIFILFFFYFFIQLIGLYQNDLLDFNINLTFLPILAIGTLSSIFIIKFYKVKNIKEYLLFLSIFFLFVITLSILFILKDEFYIIDKKYLYGFVPLDKYLFNNTLPRITGISRSIAIINIFLITCFFFLIKKKINKLLIIILIVIFTLLLWIFQSRGAILCFIIVNIFIFIFSKNRLLKLFFIFFICVAPILIYETYFFTKTSTNFNTHLEKKDIEDLRITKISTSGRIDLWKAILAEYDKNKIFGYGPQADRLLLGTKIDLNSQYGNNVSNALIYSFVCGGYLSFLIFLLIKFKLIFYLYKIIFTYKIFYIKNLISEKISTSFILFFLIRSIFENSFAIFSIDYLMLIISVLIVNNFLEKKQNYL